MFTYGSYASLPFMNVLPTMITNFGGDTQVCTLPPESYQPFYMYLNPQAQAALNGTTNPFGSYLDINTSIARAQQNAQAVGNNIWNNLASGRINTGLQNITMAKQKLNSMLMQDGITDEQKESINNLIKQLDEKEAALKELIENKENYTPEDAYKKACEIETAITKIVCDISKVAAGKKPAASDKADSADKTDNADKADAAEETDEAKKAKEAEEKKKKEAEEKKRKEAAQEKNGADGEYKYSQDVINLVEKFYNAVEGPGTKNDDFEAVCNSITKDNVIQVMCAWNSEYSSVHGESFMEAFMWDANASQKKELGRHILKCLRDKARELNMTDECRSEFAQIQKELDSWFYISNDIAKVFDSVIKKIADKMGMPDSAPYAKGSSGGDEKKGKK